MEALVWIILGLIVVVVVWSRVNHHKKAAQEAAKAPKISDDVFHDPEAASYYNLLKSERPPVQGYSTGTTVLLLLIGPFLLFIPWVVLIVQGVSTSRQNRKAAIYDGVAYDKFVSYLRTRGMVK